MTTMTMTEVAIRVAGQEALDRIDAWLRLNARDLWQFEFGGVEETGPGPRPKRRFLVRYRFAATADAENFRQACADGRILAPGPAEAPRAEGPGAEGPGGRSKVIHRARQIAARVGKGIATYFEGAPADAGPGEAPIRLPAPLASASRMVQGDAFSAHVAEVLRRGQPAAAGKIQLIGLDRLKERFGAEWDRVAGRADDIARRVIQGRLSRADIFTVLQGWKYLILFADLSVEEAQVKSTLIAEEISRAILGDREAAGLIEVRSATVAVDGKLTFELTPTLEDILAQLARRTEAAAAERDALGLESAAPPAFAQDPLDAMRTWYRPMLDAKSGHAAAFHIVPAFEMPDGRLVFGEHRIPDLDLAERRHLVDLAVVGRAVADLNATIGQLPRRLIGVSVNFETLSVTAHRIDYLRRLDSVLWPAKRMIVFRIKNLPDGASPSRIHEMIMALKRHARAVTLELPLNGNYVGVYRGLALHSVGVDLAALGLGAAAAAERAADLARFAQRARKFGYEPFADGLATPAMALAARSAGYRYLIGDGITAPLPLLADPARPPGRAPELPAQIPPPPSAQGTGTASTAGR